MLSSIVSTAVVALLSASTILAAPVQMNENEKRFSGTRMTYYNTGVGLGACGNFHPDSDWTVALNSAQFGNSYPSSECGKVITISYGGKTAQATIQDACPSCPYGGLDLSPSLFQHFTDLGTGVIYADWDYGSGAPAPAPQPTTTSQPPPPPTSTYVAPTTSWTPEPTTSSTPPPAPTSTYVAPTTSSYTPPPTTSSTPPPPSSSSTPVPSSTPSSFTVQSSTSSVVASSQSNTILNNLFSTSSVATGTATASATVSASASASASATQSAAGSTQSTTQAGGVKSSNLEMLSGVIVNIGRLVVVSA